MDLNLIFFKLEVFLVAVKERFQCTPGVRYQYVSARRLSCSQKR